MPSKRINTYLSDTLVTLTELDETKDTIFVTKRYKLQGYFDWQSPNHS